MIDSIRISIMNGYSSQEYFIDCNKKIININGVNKDISIDRIDDLVRFFLSWNKEYFSNNIIDCEEYYVVINSSSGETCFHGKGNYPNNYTNFKMFLGEL